MSSHHEDSEQERRTTPRSGDVEGHGKVLHRSEEEDAEGHGKLYHREDSEEAEDAEGHGKLFHRDDSEEEDAEGHGFHSLADLPDQT